MTDWHAQLTHGRQYFSLGKLGRGAEKMMLLLMLVTMVSSMCILLKQFLFGHINEFV